METPQVPGYRLDARLGAGSSGEVWAGCRLDSGQRVAVKVVRLTGSAEEADEAAREFGVLQRVGAEGVVRVHEAVALPVEQPTLAIVLDLLEGGSLASALAARGHLSVGESVTVLSPIARALAGLHAAGFVHADVSPGNVLFERTGRPVLGDLGVARLVGEAPGEVFGTEGFTAPEVEMGQLPTPASDVYAVGALAWMCVTGQPPAPMALRRPLEELAPGLPAAWTEAVMGCLAPMPSDRPSAAEAALLLFDSVACEPLRLVVGADEVSLLTRRIRSAPPPPEAETPRGIAARVRDTAMAVAARVAGLAGMVDRGHALPSLPGLLLRRAGGPRQPHLLRWPGLPRLTGGRAVGLAAVTAASAFVAAVALTGLAGAGPAAGRAEHAAGAAPASPSRGVTAVPTRPGVVPTRAGAAVPARDIRQARDAPRADALQLMQAIADTRAAVMESGDPRRLGSLDAPGSPAWAADERVLSQLRQAGQRYSGVGFLVRSARAAGAGGSQATLTVVVDTLPYAVVERSGSTHRQPPVAGAEMTVHLVWTGGTWLVQSVAPGQR